MFHQDPNKKLHKHDRIFSYTNTTGISLFAECSKAYYSQQSESVKDKYLVLFPEEKVHEQLNMMDRIYIGS
jgi:hypothetical protein